MSRKYKFHQKDGLYFVSFATVNWVDLFTREIYSQVIIESLEYCRVNTGLEVFCYCIMPSHIMRAENNSPTDILGKLKEYTSKKLRIAISESVQDSPKEWMLAMFQAAGRPVMSYVR